MPMMKPTTSGVLATLIGDVVRSRAATDRSVLHEQLTSLLAEANAKLQPVVPFRVTVGDEYQGCFDTLGEALHATLWLRVHLAPRADVRHGVGWGSVAVLADNPRVEDGPGWWAARAAIESVKTDSARAAKRHLRTWYDVASGAEGHDPAPINAALLCRDHMVGSLADRSLRLLRGMVDGYSQAELAASEGVSASAVSQRVRNDGLAVIVEADELLRGVQ
jgi:hypothetical protein